MIYIFDILYLETLQSTKKSKNVLGTEQQKFTIEHMKMVCHNLTSRKLDFSITKAFT